MNDFDSHRELLLRCLDGRGSADELRRLNRELKEDPNARAFLREIAEHAVIVADLERMAEVQQQEPAALGASPPAPKSAPACAPILTWRRAVAAAAGLALLAAAASRFIPADEPSAVRVAKATGANQYFGSKGDSGSSLGAGSVLQAGDTLETRSCDAWIELDLRLDSAMTIAGHSALRILDAAPNAKQFLLMQGNLWVGPDGRRQKDALVISTPTARIDARGAQFDVQASDFQTVIRVNEGALHCTRLADGRSLLVPAGHQVTASLSRGEDFSIARQPEPIDSWSGELARIPDVILGRWLPPTSDQRARLGSEPLLWPIPDRDPLLLYAVAISARSGTDRRVLLHADTVLRFRGRTAVPETVRFGFSTQKMGGVFSGKFETDVEPAALGLAGKTWEVELRQSDFRPLHPQLRSSPEGLELTDVYALTINIDAGLEINHIEVTPR